MEGEKPRSEHLHWRDPLVGSPTPFSKSPSPQKRGRSSLRLKYEAEIGVLRRKIGGLEDIRKSLGLSQRKICQLLLVDPSAWTRWTKEGQGTMTGAPPHIYRMLQWYLALEEKYPAMDTSFWLNTVARISEPIAEAHRDHEIATAKREIEALKNKVSSLEFQLPKTRGSARNLKGLFLGLVLGLLAGGVGVAVLFLSFKNWPR